jgi:hypothetical protein
MDKNALFPRRQPARISRRCMAVARGCYLVLASPVSSAAPITGPAPSRDYAAAEVAMHPSEANDTHELYLMCPDVHAFIDEVEAKGAVCSESREERWGSITNLTLPGRSPRKPQQT